MNCQTSLLPLILREAFIALLAYRLVWPLYWDGFSGSWILFSNEYLVLSVSLKIFSLRQRITRNTCVIWNKFAMIAVLQDPFEKEKCQFLQKLVEYLGHVVDAEGLQTTAGKLEAIVHTPVPQSVQQLRSFLCLVNYCAKFIPNLATLLSPLNELLKKDHSRWNWASDCTKAFQLAKDTLSSSKVLVHFDSAMPLKLEAGASGYGVGAVVSYILTDSSERPIAFALRTLSTSEKIMLRLRSRHLPLHLEFDNFTNIYTVDSLHWLQTPKHC